MQKMFILAYANMKNMSFTCTFIRISWKIFFFNSVNKNLILNLILLNSINLNLFSVYYIFVQHNKLSKN
jgi:hypothetical protein